MIVKLNSSAPAGGEGKGSGSLVAVVLLGLAALWAGYEFWYKPNQEAEKLAAIKAKAESTSNEDNS